MQSLTISECNILEFSIPFIRPFTFAGHTISKRSGFYLDVKTQQGLTARGEIAPLVGLSPESLKKAKHDADEICLELINVAVPLGKNDLIQMIHKNEGLNACCSSVRFAIESTFFLLSAQANNISLSRFLDAEFESMPSAALLQGSHEQVISDASKFLKDGYRVFKLKVGDRNIPLDVKKVQDLRKIIGPDCLIRLDGNRAWSLSEAILFAQLVGHAQIEFIEEPLSDMSKSNEFYQTTHMPIALDETLLLARCGVTAPGRCMPTLASHEGVKAYIIKPMILGGIVIALDWINEANRLGKKAIISSAFESSVGLGILKDLACLTGQPSGLGTECWYT